MKTNRAKHNGYTSPQVFHRACATTMAMRTPTPSNCLNAWDALDAPDNIPAGGMVSMHVAGMALSIPQHVTR